MWDSVALSVYGDERYINILLDANPDYAHMPILSGGLILICPDVSVETSVIAPPWRR